MPSPRRNRLPVQNTFIHFSIAENGGGVDCVCPTSVGAYRLSSKWESKDDSEINYKVGRLLDCEEFVMDSDDGLSLSRKVADFKKEHGRSDDSTSSESPSRKNAAADLTGIEEHGRSDGSTASEFHSCKDNTEPDAAELGDEGYLPSKGAVDHASGECKPCAWHWKPGGCTNGYDCDFCHLCGDNQLRDRRRARLAFIKEAEKAQRMMKNKKKAAIRNRVQKTAQEKSKQQALLPGIQCAPLLVHDVYTCSPIPATFSTSVAASCPKGLTNIYGLPSR